MRGVEVCVICGPTPSVTDLQSEVRSEALHFLMDKTDPVLKGNAFHFLVDKTEPMLNHSSGAV